MCWGLKVFCRVFGNLAGRILANARDSSYKMFTVCRLCTRNNISIQGASDHQREDSWQVVEEPREQFYRDVNREMAERILENRQNGTFVIRPSQDRNCSGTLSIIQDKRIFHLNIRRRRDGMIALGSEKHNEKSFRNLNAMINYHISNYLILYSRGKTYRTLLIPYRDKTNEEDN